MSRWSFGDKVFILILVLVPIFAVMDMLGLIDWNVIVPKGGLYPGEFFQYLSYGIYMIIVAAAFWTIWMWSHRGK